jgi:hypothetical protein
MIHHTLIDEQARLALGLISPASCHRWCVVALGHAPAPKQSSLLASDATPCGLPGIIDGITWKV